MNNIVDEYKAFLIASDKRIRGIRFSISLLNKYLDEHDYELISLNYMEAQGFQSWLNDSSRNYTPASIHAIIGPISSLYDYMKDRKFIISNPFDLIDRIKQPFTIPKNIPSEEDMNKLLDYLAHFTRGKNLREYKRDYKLHILCELLYSTGIRINEAASIKVNDVDFITNSILIFDTKTNQERVVYLNDYVKNILRIYIEEFKDKVLWYYKGANPSLLFGSKKSIKTWVNVGLTKACNELEVESLSAHIFRHAFGYHMLRAGCDIRKIQKFLGHKSLSTTGIYTKVDTEALRNILDKYHPRRIKRR